MSKDRYPAYPKYKNSGLGWLSAIPDHWETKRLKFLGEAIIGLTYSPDDVVSESEGTLVLRSSNIQNGKLAFEDNVHVKRSIPEKLRTRKGDILICSRNGSRALIGKNAQIDSQAAGVSFGAFMTVFRSPLNGYISKVFNSSLFEYQSGSFLTSTINQLTTATLNDFEIPVPPLLEQTQIAQFLDHETAKIDRLIEKQEELIRLLKEKRQAVISHAVTKGLNPHAPLKDSGIEWLGQVPAHWKVNPIRYLITKIEQGWSPQCDNRPADDNEWGVLKVGCGNRETFDPSEQKALPANLRPEIRYEIKAGDILLSRGNSLELVGMATFTQQVRPRLLLSDLLYRLRTRPESADSEFLVYSLRSPQVRFQIESEATGTSPSMKKIGQENIRGFIIAIPPLSEQRGIVEYIKDRTAKLDVLTRNAQRAISLLQERRTALISAAVTGKIDVRAWQPPVVSKMETTTPDQN